MSQMFDDNKKVIPVTLIEAGPCWVTQIKTPEKDGYQGIQIGFEETKKTKKPQGGHLKDLRNLRFLREFRLDKKEKTETSELKIGEEINVSVFQPDEKVQVSSLSKGKGFAGVVKRHGFAGGPASHGQKHSLRAPGSIGCGFPERVWKGRRMGGRAGNERVTVKGLKIAKIDEKENLLALKGAVPGRKGCLVEVVSQK